MIILVSIACILVCVNGAPGSCPEPKPMKNFDMASYANGRWFEIGRYDDFNFENKADCVIFDYSREGDSYIFKLREIANKKEDTFTANVNVAPGAGNNGLLYYNVHRGGEQNLTMSVLDTDYKNYAIFYYCKLDNTGAPISTAFIKSRTPTMPPEVRAKVDKIIADSPLLDASRFVWDHFTHDDCLMNI